MAITPETFARKIVRGLQRAGERDLELAPGDLQIRWPSGRLASLHNFYDEHVRLGYFGRRRHLATVVGSLVASNEQRIPDALTEALPDLLPRVRERAFHDIVALRYSLEQGLDYQPPPLRPFADVLAYELVYDTTVAIASITRPQLELWGASFDELFDRARANMRARSAERFEKICDGLWISPWQDNHDCGRLALLEVINHLPVRGEHLAMAPHRDLLLVADSARPEAVESMITLSCERLDDGRFVSSALLRLDVGGWALHQLPAGHPGGDALRRFQTISAARQYGEQRTLLQRQVGDDLYVAKVGAIADHDESYLYSWATWTRGVPTLLPRADLIALYDPGAGAASAPAQASRVPLLVPWGVVRDVAGGLMAERGLHPERYLVESFPSAEQLAELRAHEFSPEA